LETSFTDLTAEYKNFTQCTTGFLTSMFHGGPSNPFRGLNPLAHAILYSEIPYHVTSVSTVCGCSYSVAVCAACAESRRSDACCPDPCKRPGRGPCVTRRGGAELDEQGGSRHPCASCSPPCDGYTMAAASVFAAGITAAAMYYSR